MQARILAAQTLADVIKCKHSLTQAWPDSIQELDPRDQAFASELIYGVLRWLPQLRWYLRQLLKKPLAAGDADIDALLLCGLYQLFHLRTPDHAAVSASVDSARQLGKPWAVKLVNAILRRALREQTKLIEQAQRHPEAKFAHPDWLLQQLRHDWPDDWQYIVSANNQRPPLTVRVNLAKISHSDYLAKLAAAGFDGHFHAHVATAITITPACMAEHLPGFHEGLVSVQDAAAQLAAPLLDVRPGQRVLDACAAPGGKTAHLLESTAGIGELTALDVSPKRLITLRNNLQRLQLHARIVAGDAMQVAGWWDGDKYDRILLDAPCSGTGVIRRHPDIKYRRTPAAINKVSRQQADLLDALWPLLAPGGKLLYVTCSVLQQENATQIKRFLSRQDNVAAEPLDVAWGVASGAGRQLLPGQIPAGSSPPEAAEMDGFFYACLHKT
ncbi:MAG: 16S rRNA (cytosine(967)-C(5))-methyltransferase RsmB [Gammaproteobacteria bacterium]